MKTLFGQETKIPIRNDKRVILHFDYDCFYASVFENENPAVKSMPLAVQQKQIIVTCNYAARRLGLRKLQLVTEAKKLVPDLVIVLGEKLDRFRKASKNLYRFLKNFSWNGKAERLGFDEVFLDMTDIIEYNQALLNHNNLKNSFFFLDSQDPTKGFEFDATTLADYVYPNTKGNLSSIDSVRNHEKSLLLRLMLGSHLAHHIRLQLEEQMGFTASVGISTSKLLSKLVGNLNKPNGQTTLIPPYNEVLSDDNPSHSNVSKLIDDIDIGKIPGIGFKSAQIIRNHILARPAEFETGLIYGETKEILSVHAVKTFPGMSPNLLENILGGTGVKRGIGGKFWLLINGIDNDEVQQANNIPSQISIENSYLCLDTPSKILKELHTLTVRLVKQMHADLLEDDEDSDPFEVKRWIAWPKTVRLSIRTRHANSSETQNRSFSRTSRSCPLPSSIFNLKETPDFLAEKLVRETITPLIKRIHPRPSSLDISLLNVCVTNMEEAVPKDGPSRARNISRMFKVQNSASMRKEDVDQDKTYVTLKSEIPDDSSRDQSSEDENQNEEDNFCSKQNTVHTLDDQRIMEDNEGDLEYHEICSECGTLMPRFAIVAHERYHREDC